MDKILFQYERLNKTDKTIYDAMTESEKLSFEKTWVAIEIQKMRLQQQKIRSKERNRREHKVLAEKTRKERTHRLIERGAILESFLSDPENMTNDQIKTLLGNMFNRNTDYGHEGHEEETSFSQALF